jgi:molybdopterin-guanine dinucleotide biosynthesis protein MobB
MKPIIAFVGLSGSGKTTLLGSVIGLLRERGYKIAVIKHSHKFQLEKKDGSSDRLGRAGADNVVISSPDRLAIIKKTGRDLSPQEIAAMVDDDIDLVLTEGFKRSSATKIEVHRKEQGAGLLVPEKELLAVVTNEPLPEKVPQFGLDDIKPITDLIEKWLKEQQEEDTELFVNNSPIPMNRFVKDFITRTLLGMVSVLNGIGKIKSVRVTLRRQP